MSVVTFPHQHELDPSQLDLYTGIHLEMDNGDSKHALLEIPDFRTLNTLEHMLGKYMVEASTDTLTDIEEQKAMELKKVLKADVDATIDGEHEDGPYRYNIEVEEVNIVFHAITAEIEKEIQKQEAKLRVENYPSEAYDWLNDPNAPNKPLMVASNGRLDQLYDLQTDPKDHNRVYYDSDEL